MVMASARLLMPSFSKSFWLCSLTMSRLMPSRAEMSAFERPLTMASRISRWRGESGSMAGSALRKRRISWSIIFPPAATLRMASARSANSTLLSTAPMAPAASAWAMPSAVPKVVRMRIRASGISSLRRRVVSAPSISGIMRSITITSGLSLGAFFSAAAPELEVELARMDIAYRDITCLWCGAFGEDDAVRCDNLGA